MKEVDDESMDESLNESVDTCQDLTIKFVATKPSEEIMIKPQGLYNSCDQKPIAYSVKPQSNLQRQNNLLRLNQVARDTGFIDVTATYYDFSK